MSQLDATLLVPTPDDGDGTWVRTELDVVSVVLEEDDLGLMMVAFTSVDALTTWRPEGGTYVERPASWFFGVASADETGRVVIDPGSPEARILQPTEVAALAAGFDIDADPATAAAPGTGGDGASWSGGMLVATPSEPLPEPVAAAVAAALAAQAEVRSAKLLLIDTDGSGPRPVVMVELADDVVGDHVGPVMERIVATVADGTDDAGGLTFAVVTDEWRDAYRSGGIAL